MGRIKGIFNVPSNYEPLIAAPFDARQRVDYKADLVSPATWRQEDGEVYLYSGLLVAVVHDSAANNGVYLLKDHTQYQTEAAWQKIGSDITKISQLENDAGFITGTEVDAKLLLKQNKLTAGTNITIDENNVISATGGSGGKTYTGGNGITVDNTANTISADLEVLASNESVDSKIEAVEEAIPTKTSQLENDSGFVDGDALDGKQDKIDTDHKLAASLVSGLATVATTGDYNDLINAPAGASEKHTVIIKETYDESDAAKLAEIENPHNGDIAIIKAPIADGKYEYTAYVYDGEANAAGWRAMDGNYCAENVYFRDDLIYTAAIGVLPKPTSSGTIAASGKNVKEVLSSILAKEEEPQIVQPALTVNSSNIGSKEVGTKISVAYQLSGSTGSYSYGPATGVTWTSYSAAFNGQTLAGAAGTFSEMTVTDSTNLTISASGTHTDGTVPTTNIGNLYPAGKIIAGTKSGTKGTLTGYRNMFFGTATVKKDIIASADVRALSTIVPVRNLTSEAINIPVGALRVIFAVPNAKVITSIRDENGLGAEILSSFEKTTLNVEGANAYAAIPYNVYCLDYASPNDKANRYLITVANA